MNALRDNPTPSPMAIGLSWAQGLYFLITGAWPIVSVQSFQLVTGPKSDHLIADSPTDADHWMLFTISALIIAISIALLAAAWRRRLPLEICLLGIASAAALLIIDVVFVARGTIRPIYLADAAIELAIIVGWLWILLTGRRGQG
jgi:hypothetical protein